jgi:hypothetical protein
MYIVDESILDKDVKIEEKEKLHQQPDNESINSIKSNSANRLKKQNSTIPKKTIEIQVNKVFKNFK